jgi:hypothetical protein
MLTESETNNRTSWKSYLVLATFGWLTFWNSWQFMDFASVSVLGKSIFHCNNEQLNWLYSASLVVVVATSIPAIYVMESHGSTGNWSIMLVATISNVLGGWLRWLSVANESYITALLSSIVLGFAAAGIIVSIVPLTENNFPKKNRTLATTIAVQMNYLGWCLSSVIVPGNSNTKSELGHMLFIQAILISISIIAFSMFHRPLPFCCNTRGLNRQYGSVGSSGGGGTDSDPLVSQDSDDDINLNQHGIHHHIKQMGALFLNRQFLIQCICFSMLGGISFALPAVQDELFLEVGLTQNLTKWTNLAFLASGVLTGLAIGTVFHYKEIQPDDFYSMFAIRIMFGICTLSLSGLAVLASFANFMSNGVVFIIALILMAISGSCSLGFVGIALPQAVSVARPVSEVYSAGLVECLLQIWGVVFAQWCAGVGERSSVSNATTPSSSPSSSLVGSTHAGGFVICAASCGLAFFLLLFFGGNNHCNPTIFRYTSC